MSLSVEAIDSNNRRRGCLVPMAKGAAVGSAVGMVLKYTYPITSQEKSTPEYQRVLREVEEHKNIYGPENEAFINSIKSKNKLSLAEDTFVKMYDGMKEGDKTVFGVKKLREAFAKLRESDPSSAKEFRNILLKARIASQEVAQRSIDAYNLVTKHIRPTAFFVVGGAVVGAIMALVNDLLKTKVEK